MHFRSPINSKSQDLTNSSLEHHTSRIIQYTYLLHMNLRFYKILRIVMIVFVKSNIKRLTKFSVLHKKRKKCNKKAKTSRQIFFILFCLLFFLQTFIHLKKIVFGSHSQYYHYQILKNKAWPSLQNTFCWYCLHH